MATLFLVQEAFAAGGASVWPDERLGIALVAAFVTAGFAVMYLTRPKN